MGLQLLQTQVLARNMGRTERRRSLGVSCARGTSVVVVLSVDHLEGAFLSQHSTRKIHSLYRLIRIPPLFFRSASYRESGLDEFKHLVAAPGGTPSPVLSDKQQGGLALLSSDRCQICVSHLSRKQKMF